MAKLRCDLGSYERCIAKERQIGYVLEYKRTYYMNVGISAICLRECV